MDLIPQTLRDVEFREKLRGYHPDDVDDFLEEVAVALDGLLGRLRAAESAAAAPGGAASFAVPRLPVPAVAVADAVGMGTVVPDDAGRGAVGTGAIDPALTEGISRVLVLAQRTADTAVAEAEESARRTLAEAGAAADRILAEAEAKVGAMTAEARRSAEGAVAELDQRRAGLEREVASLQSWASQHRDRLREVLSDQLRSLDIWLATSAVPRPPTRMVAVPSSRPTLASSGEATALYAAIEGPAAVADDEEAGPDIEGDVAAPAADDLDPGIVGDDAAVEGGGGAADAEGHADGDGGENPRRRTVSDSPGAAVSEAVEASATLTSTRDDDAPGGGDGALFDQDGEPIQGVVDSEAPMAGRSFGQR
jgi:DivIVA domain-containing protein